MNNSRWFFGRLFRKMRTRRIASQGDAAPTAVSAEVGIVDGSTLIVVFSRNIIKASGAYKDGWSVSKNGSGDTITLGALAGLHRLAFALTSAVVAGDTVTVSYSAAGGHITSEAGTILANITNKAVTNNVA